MYSLFLILLNCQMVTGLPNGVFLLSQRRTLLYNSAQSDHIYDVANTLHYLVVVQGRYLTFNFCFFLHSAIMERSIRSVVNMGECLMPELPIDNPEIMKFYRKVDKVDCGRTTDDWVMCEVRNYVKFSQGK